MIILILINVQYLQKFLASKEVQMFKITPRQKSFALLKISLPLNLENPDPDS